MRDTGAYQRAMEHDQKIKDVALQILGVAEELHLSWADFEQVLTVIKKRVYLASQKKTNK